MAASRFAILPDRSIFNFQFSISHQLQSLQMTLLFAAYASFIGAIIGSFLNVVIHRYPREESVVFPPSHCPRCNARIKWYDNVPVLSWLLLGAKCRNCRGPISIRSPLIELASALFYLAIFFRTGVSVTF